jgi:hypothetical protein
MAVLRKRRCSRYQPYPTPPTAACISVRSGHVDGGNK